MNKNFYKVTFENGSESPQVTPLDDDKIWNVENGGLDKSQPFVLINNGNLTPLNQRMLPGLTEEKINIAGL